MSCFKLSPTALRHVLHTRSHRQSVLYCIDCSPSEIECENSASTAGLAACGSVCVRDSVRARPRVARLTVSGWLLPAPSDGVATSPASGDADRPRTAPAGERSDSISRHRPTPSWSAPLACGAAPASIASIAEARRGFEADLVKFSTSRMFVAKRNVLFGQAS